ncbi:hypothetical protein [Nocardioides sp.]|uniref:hypothetical protein n=1 Tax=Nocardioides sp. TaxID=35761 RepID=UPI001A1DA39F|nr:hypothetical protein [Nocardioides sp.]MBJ7356068.1 hypothetical protein [Nocardioides sp.]
MKRLTSLLAVTAFSASLLTGCGGDGGGGDADSYCDSLESIQKDFEDFEAADFSNFDEFTDRVEALADDAPDEVKEDWEVLTKAFTAFVDALEEAGLEPADLEGLANNELPEGVDMEALTEAMTEAQALGSEEVEKATENIEKHAKDECNIDLSAS